MKNLYTLLVLVLCWNMAQAQLPRTDTLYTDPTMPVAGNAFDLIYQVTYSSTQGSLIWRDVSQSPGIIRVKVCHAAGLGAAITSFRDTIELPPLAAGTYQVLFELQRGNPDTANLQCLTPSGTTRDTLDLTVQPTLTVPMVEAAPSLKVYPNPIQGEQITLESTHPIQQVWCTDGLGRVVQVQQLGGVQQHQWSVADWPRGVYFLMVETTEGLLRQKLIRP